MQSAQTICPLCFCLNAIPPRTDYASRAGLELWAHKVLHGAKPPIMSAKGDYSRLSKLWVRRYNLHDFCAPANKYTHKSVVTSTQANSLDSLELLQTGQPACSLAQISEVRHWWQTGRKYYIAHIHIRILRLLRGARAIRLRTQAPPSELHPLKRSIVVRMRIRTSAVRARRQPVMVFIDDHLRLPQTTNRKLQ